MGLQLGPHLTTLFLICISTLIVSVAGQKLRKNARMYSSPSSSSSNSVSPDSSSANYNYQDNFDSMFDSMDINKHGSQRVKIGKLTIFVFSNKPVTLTRCSPCLFGTMEMQIFL